MENETKYNPGEKNDRNIFNNYIYIYSPIF